MIRVVFDTNVLFSAIYKKTGTPGQLVDLVTTGLLTPCVSDAVMAEYEDVLNRPILRSHAARARKVLALFGQIGYWVSPTESIRLASDPSDDRFIECAIAAHAEYLITGNLRHFPARYERVNIVSPAILLRELSSEKKDAA
jgi:putative PIN family toxin of toxin-antitoxin system